MLASRIGRNSDADMRPRIRWMAPIGADVAATAVAVATDDDDDDVAAAPAASSESPNSDRATLLVSSVSTSAMRSVSEVTTSVLHASEAVSDASNRPASASMSKWRPGKTTSSIGGLPIKPPTNIYIYKSINRDNKSKKRTCPTDGHYDR